MRLRRLLSTLRLRLRSVFRRARVEQELDDEIRDHIDRRVAAGCRPRRAARTGAPGCGARLRRHRAVEGSVPGRAAREPHRAHGSGPALRGPSLRARAGRHGDDDRDLRARHRLQHRAVPVRPVVRQRSGAGHPAAGIRSSGSAASIARGRVLRSAANSRIQNIGSTRRSRRSSATSPRGRRPISSSTSAGARRTRRAAPRPTSPATISRCWAFARLSARASRSTRTTPIPRRRSSP